MNSYFSEAYRDYVEGIDHARKSNYNMLMNNKAENSSHTNNNQEANRVLRYTLRGILIGVVYLLLAWVLQLAMTDAEFSLKALWQLHIKNPSLILIDILPLIMALVLFFHGRVFDNERQEKEEEIRAKEDIIQNNVERAQLIGNRNYSFSEDDIPEHDALGREMLVMQRNLQETDRKEREQNWLSRGKDIVSDVLRQENKMEELAYNTLEKLINYIEAIQGAFYVFDEEGEKLSNIATYAYNRRKYRKQEFKIGEGLIGEAAFEKDIIYRKEIPDEYVTITSGILGDKKPKTLLILPLISDDKLQGIIEIASLKEDMEELTLRFARELGEIIGQTVFNLKVNKRTEKLLHDSQVMTEELRANEEELRKNAIEMQKTQEEVERTNKDLEKQIEEVENAQKRLYALLENASEVISIYDKDGAVSYESPSVRHILGYDPENVIGKNLFEEYDTQAYRKIKEAFQYLIDNPGETKVFEYEYQKDDGETMYLEATGRNLLNDPAINGLIFNTRDVTVRKIAEQAERRSGQMQALSENSPDMILRLDAKGEFFYVNPIVEKYTGILANNILNNKLDEVSINEQILSLFREILSLVKENQDKYETETTMPTMEGEKTFTLNGIPEFNEEAEIESVLIVAHDITQQKIIEQEIMAKNKAINDSINYAQRIQTAILPDNELVRHYLPKSFMFYMPRDVVSGDFPWFLRNESKLFISAIDCTGHGVPGAMLSFIGYFLLNNIVTQHPEYSASEILDEFHINVRKTLRQEQPNASARDGMDVAFCMIDEDQKQLQYSGAHRPLYLMRDGELHTYKGDPKAIGGIPHHKKTERNFTNYVIDYQEGDKFFFFSDGLPDQTGGPQGRKYKPIRVRELIKDNQNVSMEEFHEIFKNDFKEWMGDNKQIDDLLLIGIEL